MTDAALVTGAAGFAGSHLVHLLASDQQPVVGWHRPGGTRPSGGPRVIWQAIDLLDRAAVHQAIAALRPRVIYHCAGAAHVGRSWARIHETLAENVMVTAHLLWALQREELPARVLLAGSGLIYRPSSHPLTEDDPVQPSSPYAVSKLAAELLGVQVSGGSPVEVVLARAFNHIGPRQSPDFVAASFAQQIARIEAGRARPVIDVGDLDAERDLTDVRDTVRAYQALIERGAPARPYNVCSGRAIAVRQILEGLLAHSRTDIEIRVDPQRLRPHDVPVLVGNGARIREETGWAPLFDLQQTLGDLLEYWRDQEKGSAEAPHTA